MIANRYIKLIFLFLSMLALLAVSSCGKNTENSDKQIYKGSITIVTDRAHESQMKIAAEKFQAIYKKTNIIIKVDDNIKNDFENKNASADIISVEDEMLKFVIDKSKKNILDLTDNVSDYKNLIIGNKIYNGTVDGRIYSIPWDSLPKLIFYRKDIFTKHAININDIKTWKDYMDVGKKLYTYTGKNFTGNVGSSVNNDLNLILSNQLGTSYFNYNKKLDFDSEKWIRIFSLEEELYKENSIVNFNSESDLIKAANSGHILAFIGDPYYAHDLMKSAAYNDGIWGVMNLPAFEPGGNTDVSVGGINLMVSKNSRNPKLACGFIKFALTNDKLQLNLLNSFGRFPVNKNSYYFTDLNKKVKYFDNNIWKMFAEVQGNAYNIEYTKYFPETREKLQDVLRPSNLKEKNERDIISSIGDSVEKDDKK